MAPAVTCQVCDTDQVTVSALVAASRLLTLPATHRANLQRTYGFVPTVCCAACFIPALAVANQPVAPESGP